MKPNELRIGNFIYDSFKGRLVKLCSISSNSDNLGLDYEGLIYNENIFHIIPVPLTEEWLLKFRFNEGYTGYYYIGDFLISVEGQIYFGETETWIAEIHFVNQLQNLYFALTGDELQILP